ncbi:MAG: hypothetical protein RLZZ479_250 [Bacteroidota bacterium]|jgi:hypothetical protein
MKFTKLISYWYFAVYACLMGILLYSLHKPDVLQKMNFDWFIKLIIIETWITIIHLKIKNININT